MQDYLDDANQQDGSMAVSNPYLAQLIAFLNSVQQPAQPSQPAPQGIASMDMAQQQPQQPQMMPTYADQGYGQMFNQGGIVSLLRSLM